MTSNDEALKEAKSVGKTISKGELDVLERRSKDRIAYVHAVEALRPTGVALELAAREYAEAWKFGCGSLVEAAREYAGALAHYDRYQSDPGCTERRGTERCDPGSVAHVMLQSLWLAHGWAPLRAVYDAAQRGELLYRKDNDGREATGRLAFEMSRAVRRDLVPWLAAHHLAVPADWAARIAGHGWPPDTIAAARDLGPAAGRGRP